MTEPGGRGNRRLAIPRNQSAWEAPQSKRSHGLNRLLMTLTDASQLLFKWRPSGVFFWGGVPTPGLRRAPCSSPRGYYCMALRAGRFDIQGKPFMLLAMKHSWTSRLASPTRLRNTIGNSSILPPIRMPLLLAQTWASSKDSCVNFSASPSGMKMVCAAICDRATQVHNRNKKH